MTLSARWGFFNKKKKNIRCGGAVDGAGTVCLRTPAFSYDRSVLGISFACGLRPHAKLNPRTPLACAFLGHLTQS